MLRGRRDERKGMNSIANISPLVIKLFSDDSISVDMLLV